MTEKEIKKNTDQILRNAQKVIWEAEKAISRTECFMKENNLTQEKLENYIDNHINSESQREFDGMVRRLIEEARAEAVFFSPAKNLNSVDKKFNKKFKKMI